MRWAPSALMLKVMSESTKAPKVPGRNISESERKTRRPNLRLAPTTLNRINELANRWDCPKSYAVEVAVRLVHQLATTEEGRAVEMFDGFSADDIAGDILERLYLRDEDGTEEGRQDIP